MTTEQITQWLDEPSSMPDSAAVKELVRAYPYFLPGRYMEAAQHAKARTFTPQVAHHARLYMGNWLLFHELMNKAQLPVITETETIIPTLPIAEPEKSMAGKQYEQPTNRKEEPLIQPIFSEDYFLHQGIPVDDKLPEELDHAQKEDVNKEDPKSLMVVMSFSEWLMHFRTKTQKEKEDEDGRKAVKSMWQREKLAAALEEEADEIPENVFEMAVNSIAREDGLASESLAEILTKQGKKDQAIEMYKKLSLRNPQKSAYFAQQIAQIQKSSDL